jgi:glyoxylase-like metal-dependent hydrolase (beta-lactamase superfamily II)
MNFVNVGYRSTNYYALDIWAGKLLVDCGWPGTFPQFAAELKRKGIAPSEVRYILATHFHPDHAGLVEEFKKLGARLVLLESQVGMIQEPGAADASDRALFIRVSAENNVLVKFPESRDFLAKLGIAGEIVPTPGHSDDSITLILDEGLAFTGDLPPRMVLSDEDEIAKESWDRIYQHRITRLLPAHGS